MTNQRRLPVGAELLGSAGAHFRVWAPKRRRVEVVLERPVSTAVELTPETGGYYSGFVPGATAGTLYRYRLDGERGLYPDPAARFQPEGPHGPSQLIDPSSFPWTDEGWRGAGPDGQVIYELHLGTFTRAGTWAAACQELPELAALGITVIEVMPVAEFPGRFGWGYDGVNPFAPTRLYGTPDDARRFVDQAHAQGMAVILDVVYNHFGPDGNYLRKFADSYFTDRHKNEWGEAINFDGPDAGPVREFFLANVQYWIEEFHFDGLRLDATQQMFDQSSEHILTAITRRAREAACGRATLIVAENEPQESRLVRAVEQGGCGMDALWNDDFHHSALVALTGHTEAYYSNYQGTPQELLAAVKWGFLYQGQHYTWQKQRRGTPALDLPPSRFITFLQNHDQVANSGQGLRCHLLTSPGRYRALTALWLLAPGTPMFFQGQEFAASSPFYFFADHAPQLARLVSQGRRAFLAQFPTLALPEVQARLPDPGARTTFERCRLDFSERATHGAAYALHRDLLTLRRTDPCFRDQRRHGVDGAVLGTAAFVLRYFAVDGLDRLVVVNLGRDFPLVPAPEPLLAPPLDRDWALLWSSEDLTYGGQGTAPVETDCGWRLPGEATMVLFPKAR